MPTPRSRVDPAFRAVTAANASPYTLDGTNTYLLGRRQIAIIDPGPDDPVHVTAVLEEARTMGEIAVILVTHSHADHLGAAASLAIGRNAPIRRFGAGEHPLGDNETVQAEGLTLRALHTPGHAADHMVFYWEERCMLFSGDLILGSGTVVLQARDGALEEYLASLERLAHLEIDMIAPGHGPSIDDPHARIEEYLAHRRMREAQILESLGAGPRTPGEIVGDVYRALDPMLHPAAESTVRAHLLKLVRDGRVRRDGNRYDRA